MPATAVLARRRQSGHVFVVAAGGERLLHWHVKLIDIEGDEAIITGMIWTDRLGIG